VDDLLRDLRNGLRIIARNPGFSLLVVMVLALGIGANTAIFSVVSSVLLRDLPYPNPEGLVRVYTINPSRLWSESAVSLHDFRDWQAQNQVFAHLAAFNPRSANISGGQEPERIDYAVVTADFFSVLGSEPILGRGFLAEEDSPGQGNVVVLSYGFWQRYFGADPSVVGRQLSLNGESVSVVGVMPAHVRFPTSTIELWKPIASRAEDTGDRAGRWLSTVARLKPGITLEQAESEMGTIAARLAQTYPESNRGWGVTLTPLQRDQTSRVRPALLLLWGAVGLVLLIACANVANLLLVRAAARSTEVSIRSALGAGRIRIIRQLLTESLLLSCLGGAVGWLLAIWGTKSLPGLSADGFAAPVEADRWVLIYSIGLSMLTGVLSGLLPALKASKTKLSDALKEGSHSSAGPAQLRVRGLLVVSEIALTLVLLVGAGLLLQSFVNLLRVDLGFEAENLLTMRIAPPQAQQRAEESLEDFFERFRDERRQMVDFYRSVVERTESLPDVESAGVINVPPLSGRHWTVGFNIEGRPAQSRSDQPTAFGRVVSPGFLETVGIPLLEGRLLTAFDDEEAPAVAVVNRTMARRHWPNESPIGKRIRFGENPEIFQWVTIVGLVGDAHLSAIETAPDAAVFIPFPQAVFGHFGDWGMTLMVRSLSSPTTLVGAIRDQVHQLDPTLPLYRVRTMEQLIDETVAQRRVNVLLLGIFAGLALVLALVGVYSVISYSISQRAHELGVRIALGAQRPDIVKLVLGHGLVMTLVGVGLGLAITLALSRLLTSFLYGVGVADLLTLAGVSALLIVTALAACLLPARRATKVDPMTALQCE
jgi:putative ABC transport system permease protein